MISVLITSFNRFDLLQKTIESLENYIDTPIEDFIIIEDSGNEIMNELLTQNYSHYHLILHEQNKGAYESIDEAYSHIKTKYVLHVEDDWEFTKGGFIKPSIKILESNPMIMQVNLSNEENMPIIDSGLGYGIMGQSSDGYWNGFTCRPAVRSMAAYRKIAPWTQWSAKEDFLALREQKVGAKYYELGFRAAVLGEYFCIHLGKDRCTWHN